MKKNKLGRTGLNISHVILGGGWVGGLFIDPKFDIMEKALELSLKAGIDWIDTAESYSDRKNRINTFISIFPANKPNYTLFIMLENPKINKDLIYDYRGIKTKAPYNTSGWNSVYVAGKIIEKIGPILAINNEEFTDLYFAEKFN